MIRNAMVSLLLASAFFAGCKAEKGEAKADAPEVTSFNVAVIPKGTTHEFWKSIHAGAVKAAQELGNVNIDWKGPQKEDDRDAQITVVQDFIAKQVDGIVLAPLDNVALARPVSDANTTGIPVVIIDSGLEGEVHKSFVATDNYKGGAMAARHLGEITGGQGNLIMLRYQEGSASTMAREQGFLETVKKDYPNLNILSDNQHAGATTETALQKAETLLLRFPKVTAVFCPNESSTFGMLKALRDIEKAGSVKFVGFDASQPLVNALKAGEIDGLIVQDPVKMGYLGVKTMVSVLRGETVERNVDTGAQLVTKSNMEEQAIADLLSPPLDKYLKPGA